ncbi:MAG: alpha-amylase family glycosyl hydrolase [Bacteroidia bacterium]|nr:alpha-amylase family glycosyl hydrolase [Bacteroidia bacterium]
MIQIFASFEGELHRLSDMGIDILWFMTINPVSLKNGKGTLGSPYAVADYTATNPDYGSMDDFKHLLAAIHAAGMHCIIDWVPNHTGWDNPWITEHPDWYTQDADGNIIDPIDYNTGKSWGWTDVADLNYDNAEMRVAMIDAMKFWLSEVGIDGFRVDVAHGIPVDFWAQCRDSLYQVKPLFMLAEAEVPAIRNNGMFIADYGWEMHHTFNEIAKSQGANRETGAKLVQGNLVEDTEEESEKVPVTALDIDKILAKKAEVYHKGYFMNFTSNHDENSWSGTEFQRMGEGHLAFAVLAATMEGMPLVYTGQEDAMDKQLEFFERDVIKWGSYPYAGFYKTLFDLKHRNHALWNGNAGGPLVKIPTGNDENIYAFQREKDGDMVLVVINLSAQEKEFTLQGDSFAGDYLEIFAQIEMPVPANMSMKLGPWQYLVLEKQ